MTTPELPEPLLRWVSFSHSLHPQALVCLGERLDGLSAGLSGPLPTASPEFQTQEGFGVSALLPLLVRVRHQHKALVLIETITSVALDPEIKRARSRPGTQ